MYKVIVTVPEGLGDLVLRITQPASPGFIKPVMVDEEGMEEVEFYCQPRSLPGLVEQIKNLGSDDDISLDIYKLNSIHD